MYIARHRLGRDERRTARSPEQTLITIDLPGSTYHSVEVLETTTKPGLGQYGAQRIDGRRILNQFEQLWIEKGVVDVLGHLP